MRGPSASEAVAADTQRLDKWLFFARMARTRTSAVDLIKGGHIRINGSRVNAPAKTVRPGDVLTVALERDVRVLKIVAPGVRRGPFPEACQLYEDLAPPAEQSCTEAE